MVAAVFGLSFWYRFQTLEFANDHFQTILQGRQILVYGEMPGRDFADPGFFLMPVLSAVAQAVFGYRLIGEALLCLLFLSGGAALTFLLASQVSRSIPIALGLTFMTVVMAPRLYHYPKVFLLVFGLFLCWRYVDRTSRGNLLAIAAGTAFAFLVRHDHGVYLAAAAGVTLVARHWHDGASLLARRLALYGLASAALVAPFFVYLQANGGAAGYLRSALDYTRSEAQRQRIFQFPPLVVEPALPPPPPPRIDVVWREGVTDALRSELERRYKLSAPTPLGGPAWQYEAQDASEADLRTLVNDRRVEDTNRIERATGRIDRPTESTLMSLRRIWPALGIFSEPNAVPWLYYLFVSLPFVALLVMIVGRRRSGRVCSGVPFEAAKVLGVATVCAVSAGLLLREPLNARLPDVAAPVAVLAAWLLARLLIPADAPARLERQPPLARRGLAGVSHLASRARPLALRWLVALGLVAVTWSSIAVVSQVERQWEQVGKLDRGPRVAFWQASRQLTGLWVSPPSEDLAPVPRNLVLSRYIGACTRPSDRLFVTHFQPDIYYYAGRAFAGDQFFFYHQYRTASEDQQRFLARLRAQSVPIVLAKTREYGEIQNQFPLLHDHLIAHYQDAGALTLERDVQYRVLIDPRVPPTGTYEPLSLPCFG